MGFAIRDALITIVLSAALTVALAARDPQAHPHATTHPEAGAHHHAQVRSIGPPVAWV